MNLPDLPASSDQMWEGEKISAINKPISLCSTHARENWMAHIGYIDNHDGTVTCKYCAWGTRLAGYYRVLEEKIVDLRTL